MPKEKYTNVDSIMMFTPLGEHVLMGQFHPNPRLPPVTIFKRLLPGRQMPPEIHWKNVGTRGHALVGRKHRFSYVFGPREQRTTLNSEEQISNNADIIMDWCREIMTLIKGFQEEGKIRLGLLPTYFNVATLTKYGEKGKIPYHCDDEKEHVSDLILSLSIGASAQFIINGHSLTLEDGDVVLFDRMLGHQVPKTDGTRFNVTFRRFKEPWWTWNSDLIPVKAKGKKRRRPH